MKPLVALCVVLALPAAARAQAPDADALVRAGVALRVAGDDAAALTRFRAAHALRPSGATLGQLGLVEHALGRWVEAAGHLGAALATDDPWVARNRVPLTEALAYVRSQLPPAQAVPATAVAPASVAPVDRPLPRRQAPRRAPQTLPDRPLHPVAWVGVGTGAALLAGGAASWGAREVVVGDYNDRCRGLGDPTPPAGCDERGARDAAGTAQALAVAGIATGGALFVGSIAWMMVPRASATRDVACGGGPGTVGMACGVRF